MHVYLFPLMKRNELQNIPVTLFMVFHGIHYAHLIAILTTMAHTGK